MKYTTTIIRSKRKTLCLEIKEAGHLIVRVPNHTSDKEILAFLESHQIWINRHMEAFAQRQQKPKNTDASSKRTEAEIEHLKELARKELPPIVADYAALMGVTYKRITIRHQKTRWGSCSSKGNLNFNCSLMLAPPQVRDYVIVHELAHRRQMNHSSAFWNIVEHYMPDYRKARQWLTQHGSELL